MRMFRLGPHHSGFPRRSEALWPRSHMQLTHKCIPTIEPNFLTGLGSLEGSYRRQRIEQAVDVTLPFPRAWGPPSAQLQENCQKIDLQALFRLGAWEVIVLRSHPVCLQACDWRAGFSSGRPPGLLREFQRQQCRSLSY